LILAEFLQERGYDVWVGAFGDEVSEGLMRFKEKGIATIHWDFQEKLILNPEHTLKGWGLKWRSIIYLTLKVRKLKVDVIIPYTYPPNLIFCSYFQLMGAKKCFWNQRDMGINFSGKDFEFNAIAKSTKIISNGSSGKLFLENYTNRDIEIIPNGIEVYPDKSVQRVVDSLKLKVVMVGNLHGNKDHLTLLKAWKKVVKNAGLDKLQLVLAGKPLNTFELISDYINKNQLADTVKILGEVQDVPRLLETCDIAVFSSYKEGLPNAVLECMAASLPVIASDIQGTRDALGVEYPCFFQPGDNDMLANHLIQLITDFTLRCEIGSSNRLRVQARFSLEKMGDSFETLIIE